MGADCCDQDHIALLHAEAAAFGSLWTNVDPRSFRPEAPRQWWEALEAGETIVHALRHDDDGSPDGRLSAEGMRDLHGPSLGAPTAPCVLPHRPAHNPDDPPPSCLAHPEIGRHAEHPATS